MVVVVVLSVMEGVLMFTATGPDPLLHFFCLSAGQFVVKTSPGQSPGGLVHCIKTLLPGSDAGIGKSASGGKALPLNKEKRRSRFVVSACCSLCTISRALFWETEVKRGHVASDTDTDMREV